MRFPVPQSAVTALLLSLFACQPGVKVPTRDGLVPLSDGDQLFFRLMGQGPDTLVFLVGGPGLSSRYLEDAFGRLAGSHGLLFYDPRGTGRSPVARSPDSLSLAQDVADLEDLRRYLNLGPLRVVAHHWGAALAHEYGRRYPGRVSREVLLSPLPIQAGQLFGLAKLPNDSAALARHAAARAEGLDSLDPVGYCHQFWGFQFSPIEVTDPVAVRRLAAAMCDGSGDRLRSRERLALSRMRGIGAWNFTDSSLAAAPRLVIVGAGEPLFVRAAERWAAPSEGRLVVLGRTPLFPWLEAASAVAGDVENFVSRGRWPESAILPASVRQSVTHP